MKEEEVKAARIASDQKAVWNATHDRLAAIRCRKIPNRGITLRGMGAQWKIVTTTRFSLAIKTLATAVVVG